MNQTFCQKAARIVKEKQSCLMLGLDPNVDLMPAHYDKTPAGIEKFCMDMMGVTEDLICGVKLQMAYFEIFGSEGVAVAERLLAHASKLGLLTIADAKRGDIGATAAAYAKAFLSGGPLSADAVTVNPYLGTDGITPFTDLCEKNGRGIFVLVRTSNPSAGEIQNVGEISVRVAELIDDWNISTQCPETHLSAVGAVVGATVPEQMAFYRAELPHSWMLTPGVGAQGGSLEAALSVRNADGLGVFVPVSRGVLYADTSEKCLIGARNAMMDLYAEMQETPFPEKNTTAHDMPNLDLGDAAEDDDDDQAAPCCNSSSCTHC